jgi:hypothetical protein
LFDRILPANCKIFLRDRTAVFISSLPEPFFGSIVELCAAIGLQIERHLEAHPEEVTMISTPGTTACSIHYESSNGKCTEPDRMGLWFVLIICFHLESFLNWQPVTRSSS